uniref:Regulatory protein zeste n=1 Tax=Elaeophora elaphi TaxID=1147741 RepID=A0A0R3RWL6_9BILA
MAVRNTYSLYDERLMWEYIFERLQDGDEAASKPKGLKLWKKFEATEKTNKTASSLATHFRKAMYDHIEEAKIPVEQQLYIASQLDLPLSKRQQKIIEYKENISITTNDFGIVTKYKKEEDDEINDEVGYDALELNGSSKIAKLSLSPDRNSTPVARRYNLRKQLNVGENKLREIHNSKGAEAMDLVQDNSDFNDNRNEDRNDNGDQSEIIHVKRMLDNKKENGCEQREICENAEGSAFEKQSSSNKINGRKIGKNTKVLGLEDQFHDDSKESGTNISCPKDGVDAADLFSEVVGNQVECIETTKESGTSQHPEAANSVRSLAVKNDQFGTKIMSNEISKIIACSSASTAVLEKKKQELLAFESIIDEERKQLVTYILNKRQLKGVEKMKVEKILELRAKEAKRFGTNLKSYLRKIQQQLI